MFRWRPTSHCLQGRTPSFAVRATLGSTGLTRGLRTSPAGRIAGGPTPDQNPRSLATSSSGHVRPHGSS
eukprot:7034850-Lingulodinium_polyedra.AAC.1